MVLFIYYILPALVILGSIIAIIVLIKKKGKQVFLPYAILPVISLLCMFFLGLHIKEGGPYTKTPDTENVELLAGEQNLKAFPISEQELNDIFEVCIDQFKKSDNFEYCKLNQLRYLERYSNDDCDSVFIAVDYKRGYLSPGGNNGRFFNIERKKGSNNWGFKRIVTCV
ncbi:hypothetical protein [Ruminococcus flavefaciens]|uniref:hypothetical protein n=1 Tax=Ruminococcus flavefaciens TaxID=1265 RepID=UPI00048B4B0B|nr:hypothetical protein [Ruminococcus flavefaciens]